MLYAIGFIGLFTIGGITGLFLAALGIDVHVTDTYFVVAHFHYIMVGGAVMGYLGGIHYFWPKVTGKLYPEGLARLSALIVFLGFNLTFFPQFILGYMGMPRRYAAYPAGIPSSERSFHRRSFDSGGRIPAPSVLSGLGVEVWKERGAESLAGNRAGMEKQFAAARENFEVTPVVDGPPYDFARHQEEADLGR